MYQIEVKAGLVKSIFQPAAGWRVTINVDAMERAKGGSHPRGKGRAAAVALRDIKALGAKLGPHRLFGRVDVVAEHTEHGLRLIEVEGDSSRQKEQALYSALGQLLLSMKMPGTDVRYGVAVPDTREWWHQLRKIPAEVRGRLNLELYTVSAKGVGGTTVRPGEVIPDWERH
jgi:hypothetical protein